MKNFVVRVLSLVRLVVNFLRRSPVLLRAWALEMPVTRPWLSRKLSLAELASQTGPAIEAARRTQFSEWHPEDLQPRLEWYGKSGLHEDLQVIGREFFESHGPEDGEAALREAAETLADGSRLFLYAPHSFAFREGDGFAWMPRWEQLHALARRAGLRVLDFNPTFDRNGFFHFLAERPSGALPQRMTLSGAGHYFYMNAGVSRALGNSAAVLSAMGLRALQQIASPVSEHYFQARVPEDAPVQSGDIAIGHYGLWVTGASRCGALTILYGPGDCFRAERHDTPFHEELQVRGTFAEQYQASHMVIMQTGGRWRMSDPFPYSGLCRWMDMPISPAVFPRTKKRIAPPGKRVFCFIGLYDDYQKGVDIAAELCRRCPEFSFIAIGCQPISEPNCREYKAVDNRRSEFRRIVTQADFLVSPAREDPQPGTVAECGSFGMLPIISEGTGYVPSFPRRLNVEDLDQCAAVLREAQAASAEEVEAWQALNAQYLEEFHRPRRCDALMRFYLEEAIKTVGPNLETDENLPA